MNCSSDIPTGRVVVLSSDALAGADSWSDLGPVACCVRVSSAYEAVAELLAGPVSALVADLRLLGPRHLRLLDIARSNHVRIFGVGAIPPGLTVEDLNGVLLVSRAALPAALAGVVKPAVQAPAPSQPEPPAPQPQEPQPKPQAGPAKPAAVPAHRRPLEPKPQPAGQQQDQYASENTRNLLSADELAALLGDEQ
ncbi:MAG: hypothetical protein GXY38_04280 [Planctomycetes bacterium]|nr:hypothetical protein [Planctomycetota bacterium]